MKRTRLGDISEISNGKTIPEELGDIPAYGGNGITGFVNKFNNSGPKIIVGRVGAYAGVIHFSEKDFWLTDNALSISVKDEVDYKYLYYFLKQVNLSQFQVGSSQPLVTQTMLNNLTFSLPLLIEQNRIAKMLSDLDDKIALNNKINTELEQMAREIYDYWFLQFDFPDESGQPYRSSGGRMAYNAQLKREIPEGWEVKRLYDIATFTNGLASQKFRPKGEEKYRVIKIREMKDGFTKDTEFVDVSVPEKVIVQDGDILFSWSASLEVMIWSGGIGSLNQHIFKVTSEEYPKSYVYMQLLNYLNVFQKIAENRKTTMGHITIDHLKQAKIAVPTEKIAQDFEKLISPILDKIVKNNQESRELANLRDCLLPMLMNGQVKVKD